VLLVGNLPCDEPSEDPFSHSGVAAARRLPEIDDQATRPTERFDGAIECRHRRAVSERVVEAHVADARADFGCLHGRTPAGELIGRRQFDAAKPASFADLKPARRIVTPRQHGSQGPVPRRGDRVVVRTPHPGVHRVANRHAVDRDHDDARPKAGPGRVRAVTHLRDRRFIALPLGPQVRAGRHEPERLCAIGGQVRMRVVQLVDEPFEQRNEPLAVLHRAKIGGVQGRDVAPARRLRVEVGVSGIDAPDGRVEVELIVVRRLRHQAGRPGHCRRKNRERGSQGFRPPGRIVLHGCRPCYRNVAKRPAES
jgi:hypothetical protein